MTSRSGRRGWLGSLRSRVPSGDMKNVVVGRSCSGMVASTFASSSTEPRPVGEIFTASLSAPGFLTLARGTVSDAAIQHHQVVAIRRASARSVQLGVTQWLRTEEDGSLSVGLRLLSGTPRVVEFDTTAAQANSAEGSAGILLAVNPSVRMPSSLVVACGTFRPGRKLRLRGGERRAVRLTRLAEQGADFERAEFQFAD